MSARRALIAATVTLTLLLALVVGFGLSNRLSTRPSGGHSSGLLSYDQYRSMVGEVAPGMMGEGGGDATWLSRPSAYRWMMGTREIAPGWMTGDRGLHRIRWMMGSYGDDMGAFVGRLFADAPGPMASRDQVPMLGAHVPIGVRIEHHRVVVLGSSATLTVVAATGRRDAFVIAGQGDPTVVMRAGTALTVEFVNADPDRAHGFIVAAPASSRSRMPMMKRRPAFLGADVWFLGRAGATSAHVATIRFVATTPGTYRYLCPVPDHARAGLDGSFLVTPV